MSIARSISSSGGFTPFDSELLWEYRRGLVLVAEGKHDQVQDGQIEEKKKHGQQNEFEESLLSDRVVVGWGESSFIAHLPGPGTPLSARKRAGYFGL
jgi:hypothetical protein